MVAPGRPATRLGPCGGPVQDAARSGHAGSTLGAWSVLDADAEGDPMWFVIALPIVVGGGIAVTRWVKRRLAEADARDLRRHPG